MNDDEKELLKVGAETAMKPFAELITKLFGGPAEQLGGIWTDGLAARRQIRQIKLFQKIQRAIDEAGFEPKTIRDKIWVRLLQNALLEDNDDLHNIWANLIANASDPRFGIAIRESFGDVLRQLSSDEVRFLDRLFEYSTNVQSGGIYLFQSGTDLGSYGVLLEIFHTASHGDIASLDDLGPSRDAFEISLDTLRRTGILKPQTQVMQGNTYADPIPWNAEMVTQERHLLTSFGCELIRACRPPVKS